MMRGAVPALAAVAALALALSAPAPAQVNRPSPGNEQPRSGNNGGGGGFGGVGLSISLGGKKKKAPVAEPPLTGPDMAMRDRPIPDYVAGQVLFFLSDAAANAGQIARTARVTLVSTAPLPEMGVTMAVATLLPGDTVDAAVGRLGRTPKVAWAQPDFNFQVLGNSREQGAGMSRIRIGPKQKVSGTIALIDSPVDLANPALRGAAIVQEGFGGSLAPAAHGTAIAEILVGTGPFAGVAQGANLVSLAAFAPAGEDWWQSQTSKLALALNRAIALRPQVVNMSFGTVRDDPALARALARFEAIGACVVAAAGNAGGGRVLYPGRDDRVVAVTAIDGAKRIYAYASRGPEIDVAAWGVSMNAAVPGGRRAVSGTSFATAIVTGALLRDTACTSARNPAAMRSGVFSRALDLGPKGRDDQFGAGLFRLP